MVVDKAEKKLGIQKCLPSAYPPLVLNWKLLQLNFVLLKKSFLVVELT